MAVDLLHRDLKEDFKVTTLIELADGLMKINNNLSSNRIMGLDSEHLEALELD